MGKKIFRVILLIMSGCISLAALAAAVFCAIKFAPVPVYDSITIEAGSEQISPEMFMKDDFVSQLVTDTSGLDLNTPGEYQLEFLYHKKSYFSQLVIADTTAPVAKPVAHKIYSNQTLNAEDFVTDVFDLAEVTIDFAVQPDFTKAGNQVVLIRLTDTSGNIGQISAQLTVLQDATFPEFSPMEDLTVNIGQAVSYRKGITATDDRDGEIPYTIDNSAVNLQQPGTYILVYTAVDSSGNTTKVERKIHVTAEVTINQELVDEMVQKVLEQIITDDMTAGQKIQAIFNHVRRNVAYAPSRDDDILTGAYHAMANRKGDCYNYFALSKVLLDACGIDNMRIDRAGGTTSHVWLLVNAGTGWYHFDSSPQSMEDPYRCLMKTDAQVKAYANGRSDGRSDYYNFDPSLYPERATETFKIS